MFGLFDCGVGVVDFVVYGVYWFVIDLLGDGGEQVCFW